jgi:hypothetical protein
MPKRVSEAGSGVAVVGPRVAVKVLVSPKLVNVKAPRVVPNDVPVVLVAPPDAGPIEVVRP